MYHRFSRAVVTAAAFFAVLAFFALPGFGQTWLDNTSNISNNNQSENVRRSDHFRIVWGKQPTSPIVIDEDFIQTNLQDLEYDYKKDHSAPPYGFSFRDPSVPNPNDGNLYRANMYINNTHGVGTDGFAYGWTDGRNLSEFSICAEGLNPLDPPSDVHPHEYGHGNIIASGGLLQSGEWHEGFANWFSCMRDDDYDPSICRYQSWYPLPHGRDFYGAWPIWEAFRESTNFGPLAISNAFAAGGVRHIFNELAYEYTASPDGYDAVKRVFAEYAAKSITWDYQRGEFFALHQPNFDPRFSFVYPVKDPTPRAEGIMYRCPWEQAPSQHGFNVIPLTVSPSTTVTVNFNGIWDYQRGTDYRVCFVAVSDNNTPRYSRFWNQGTNSITLSADERKLYLIVVSTPDVYSVTFNRDLQTDIIKEPMAYEFMSSASVAEPVNTGNHSAGWHQHSNGGGWVQNSATVAASAYVGPNAIVQDYATVSGNARIEDYAVVAWHAQVRDNAVVSGHALVTDSSQIYGNAKVRDWGLCQGTTQIYGDARILEHGNVIENVAVYDNACVRGYAVWYGQGSIVLNGHAIVDGDGCDGSNLDHGTSTGWSWGPNQAYDDGLPDTGGIFCQYLFENSSPVYAKDTYGMAWGYLIGRPSNTVIADSYRGSVLQLDGASQYIECPRNLQDVKDTTYMIWVYWTGSGNDQRIFSFGNGSTKYMYLTPKDGTTNNVRFVISNGTTTQYLDGTAPLTANRWTHLAVSFSGNTGTLYVDGTAVDTDTAFTLNPDDLMDNNTLNANVANFIGKGGPGNYFQGLIDDFRTYSLTKDATFISGLAAQFTDRNAGVLTTPSNPTTLWYKFNETSGTSAADSSGSGKNGTVTSGTWTTGYTNNSLQFNGTSTRVTVPTLSSSVSQFTVTMWVYVTGIKGGTSWDANAITATDNWGAGDIIAEIIGTGGGSGQLQWSVNGCGDVYSNTKFTTASGNQNKWVHLALVYDSTTGALKIYVNGILDAAAAGTPGVSADLTQLRIGCWNGNTRYYKGKIDEFRIYNKALSTGEIALFGTGDTTPPSPSTSTWLVAPNAVDSTTISMSATKATDPNGVEYNFTCTAGGGHNSGWITSNQYTDCGLTPGTMYTYTVQTRDGKGNTGTASAGSSATPSVDSAVPTPNPATFAIAPRGLTSSSITMSATKGSDANPLIEYKFTGSNGHTSGWQASPTWTDTSLPSGASLTYTVQMRDGNGNTGTVSATSALAYVRDNTPPTLPGATYDPITSPWLTRPIVRTNGTIWMTSKTASDPSGVQYYFHCSSGGGPDSGWQDDPHWTSPVVADGTYTYQVKVRDKSAYNNETAYVGSETFTKSQKNSYHTYTLAQLAALPDDYLVSFENVPVTAIGSNYYTVSDGTNSIKVMPNTTNSVPNSSLLNVNVNVKGCMWTYTGLGRTVVYATVVKTPTIYTVTSSTGANGTISPLGAQSVYENSDITFTITPNTGYTVDTLLVDGVAQTTTPSYTFTSVTANHTISVTFKADNNPTALLHYKFNETTGTAAADSTGHGRTGTLNSGATWAAGKYNNAVSLDGSTGYVSVPDLGTLSNFTIATWVYLNSLPTDLAEILATDTWDTGSLHCHINSSGQVTFGVNGWTASPSSTTALSVGAWYNVVLVYNGTTAYVYINGTSRGSATTGSTPANLTSVKLGTWQGTSRFLNGKFDEYWIFNKALSSTEITNLYNNTLNITASTGTGGSISPTGTVAVPFGNDQTFTITPNAGYNISSVMVDGIYKGTMSSYTFYGVTVAHSISASFTIQTFTISASAGAGGSISPNGNTIRSYGGSQTYTITPSAGYAISDVKVDNVSQGAISSYTFSNINANHTISATFTQLTYTITASAGSNGLVSPSGVTNKTYGQSQAYTITPNPGYGISELKIEGTKITPVLGYTFSNISANHTISATFSKIIAMSNRGAGQSIAAGKVVRVWGNVKSINGTTSFVISDGFKETGVTIMNNGVSLPSGFAVGKTVLVTGLMGADKAVQAQVISIYP